ncbi:hypothetical protein MMC17_007094 [Xylographa soralifera]|nr:hypothetical protein [Xylographa soralifera]
MEKSYQPHGVLFVGSVPLASNVEVFKRLCEELPQRLSTIPDGETGERCNYIGWQTKYFPSETVHLYLGGTAPSAPTSNYTIESVQPTRYNEAAISSYKSFIKLREEGIIPQNLRFQVSLPTPFNCILGPVRPEFQEQLEPLYEKRFLASLDRILREIPAEDLVVQWDMCFDVIALEFDRGEITDQRFKPYFSPVKEGLLERLSRLCAVIPPNVGLAFHLCYGDLRHKHFLEPKDTGLLVDLANSIVRMLDGRHDIEWFHLPVPKGRTDAAYFEPLKKLDIKGARLYLGLVHVYDEEGTQERIRVAYSTYQRPFGVATECGMGRTPKEHLDSILHISKRVTTPENTSKLNATTN